ncbi:MAG: M20/M25/M40 family metallo-hydrolase [Firmicutes bacterium]|nr:M20/M25/M40 family metallo-hydrolase [Bacillota bacterium]
MLGYIILAAIAAFIAVILVRTLTFTPKAETTPEIIDWEIDGDKAVDHLAQMIRCKTVSHDDITLEDDAEFDKFKALLRELYPKVFEKCEYEEVGRRGIFIKMKGKGDGQPSVFMAHYDVVPVMEKLWKRDAFCGEVIDGELWGRGTLDTKITLCGSLEAAEMLLEQGFVPENDIIFAYGGDEETSGASAEAATKLLAERGIVPAFVLDEGGAVVENVFPGVKEQCAVIGIAEKGLMNIDLTISGNGGHAATPPPKSNIGQLADAVAAIEKNPFPRELTKPIAEMFDTLGRRSTFLYKMIFANLWCFMPVLDMICRKSGGDLNAMMRTTVAFTKMEGSDAYNVMPPVARVGANLRLMGSMTADKAVDYLNKVVNNKNIEITVAHKMDPSPYSVTDTEGWQQLKDAVSQTWPGAVVSPYLMLQCSDCRHYSRISPNCYRFSAMHLTSEERARIHGNNERVPVEKVKETVKFYLNIISKR